MMANARHLFLGLQILSIVFCFVLFVLLMLDSYEKFSNKMTSVGVRMLAIETEKKIPPCVTVCPLEGFKTRGFFYKEKEFLMQTYEIDDILLKGEKYDFLMQSIYNNTYHSIQEVQSVFLGRCYTICQKLTLKNIPYMYTMVFNRSRDLKCWYFIKNNLILFQRFLHRWNRKIT